MVGDIRRALDLAGPGVRRQVTAVAALALLSAVLEAVTFAAVVPLGTVVAGGDLPAWAGWAAGETVDDTIARLALAVGALYVVKTAVGLVNAWIGSSLAATSSASIASRLFKSYMALPYEMHLQRRSGDSAASVNHAVNDVSANIIGASTNLVADGAILVAIGASLLGLEPGAALFLVVYLLVAARGFSHMVAPRMRAVSAEELRVSGDAYRQLLEGLGGVKALLAAGAIESAAENFEASQEDLAGFRRRRGFMTRLPQIYLEIVLVGGVAGVAAFLFSSGSRADALGLLAGLVSASLRLLPSMSRVLSARNLIHAARPSLERLQEEIALGESFAVPSTDEADVEFRRSVAVRQVRFRYAASDLDALRDITFELCPGQSLGVVGPSGAGKSTLMDIVLGLLLPTGGELLVDGVPVDQTTLRSWRRHVAYVPQEVFLLDATIEENVRFGTTASHEEVLGALGKAELGAFVSALHDGADTVVGERGVRLSGGQRQRLGIARAIARRPKLLVLDEATSAMDNETEAAIADTVHRLSSTMATMIVAHRLSTVRRCDRILVLEDGVITGDGSFEDLRATNTRFGRLVELGKV